MPLFQIKSRLNGIVRFEGEYDSLAACVEAAVKYGADLYGADLTGARLPYARLSGARFCGADLSGAYLVGADFSGADLSGADLYGARLSGVRFCGADLSNMRFSGADLSGANFSGAMWRETKLGRRGLVKYANRSDGYEFRLFACEDGLFRVAAECRWFTMEEAWQHWRHRAGTDLGSETDNILSMFKRHIELMAKEPSR
jgi:hypothetical protein